MLFPDKTLEGLLLMEKKSKNSDFSSSSIIFFNKKRIFLIFLENFSDPFRRFSMHVWQNTGVNTVTRAMVCDVYFLFS